MKFSWHLGAPRCILPHAFGDPHQLVGVGLKLIKCPFKHKDLLYGKDLRGEKLRQLKNSIFKDYCTDAVAQKLAPMTNLQSNESLNSDTGSKNPKI